jgi:hypothetical protein
MGSSDSGYDPVAECCEHGNEYPGSMKGENFFVNES